MNTIDKEMIVKISLIADWIVVVVYLLGPHLRSELLYVQALLLVVQFQGSEEAASPWKSSEQMLELSLQPL